jgi:predicted DNA-binding protein
MAMVRKQIYISPEQDKMLKRLARQTGKTEAEIIRDSLQEHEQLLKEKKDRMEAWRAIEATAEAMKLLPAAAPSRRWKREDLHDRHESSNSLGHKRPRVRL